MVNIIFFGPPGSGKGTQSANLIKKYGLIHLSTGDLLRSGTDAKTAPGLEAKTSMDQRQLGPDEVVRDTSSSTLAAKPAGKGFILDGPPRGTAQAEALDKLLAVKRPATAAVLSLEAPRRAPT